MQGVVELRGDHLRDLARRLDRVVVDLAHGHQLGGGAGQEDLVREVELRAADVALDDLEIEVAGDLHHRLAVDPVENRRRVRRRQDLAVADDEDVLARALADEAALVEQDRLVVARVVGLGLGEDRVQVLPRRLRVRDQPVGRDPPPRGHPRADADVLALLAEVGAPVPGGDHHLDRRLREQAHLAVAAEEERADVAGVEAVAPDQLVRRRPQLVELERHRQVVQLRRLLQPREVVLMAEDRGPGGLGVVGPDALEDAGAVVEAVAEDVDLGVVPCDELTVHPDRLGLPHFALLASIREGRLWRMRTRLSRIRARRSRLRSSPPCRRGARRRSR